jgi:hypothetical protein
MVAAIVRRFSPPLVFINAALDALRDVPSSAPTAVRTQATKNATDAWTTLLIGTLSRDDDDDDDVDDDDGSDDDDSDDNTKGKDDASSGGGGVGGASGGGMPHVAMSEASADRMRARCVAVGGDTQALRECISADVTLDKFRERSLLLLLDSIDRVRALICDMLVFCEPAYATARRRRDAKGWRERRRDPRNCASGWKNRPSMVMVLLRWTSFKADYEEYCLRGLTCGKDACSSDLSAVWAHAGRRRSAPPMHGGVDVMTVVVGVLCLGILVLTASVCRWWQRRRAYEAETLSPSALLFDGGGNFVELS